EAHAAILRDDLQTVDPYACVAQYCRLDATGKRQIGQALLVDRRPFERARIHAASHDIHALGHVEAPGVDHHVPVLRLEPIDVEHVAHVAADFAILLADQITRLVTAERARDVVEAQLHHTLEPNIHRRDDLQPQHV